MKWWPLIGIKDLFTEKRKFDCKIKVTPLNVFKRSLFVFLFDGGNSNLLNFNLKALKSPQYNTHRFGIFFTETPRHADLLIILGPVCKKMVEPLKETINQLPEDFGILIISEDSPIEDYIETMEIPNLLAKIKKDISPEELLGLLLKIMGRKL